MTIYIEIKDEKNEILWTDRAFSFEQAEESLGRLERAMARDKYERSLITPSMDGLSGEEEELAIQTLKRDLEVAY